MLCPLGIPEAIVNLRKGVLFSVFGGILQYLDFLTATTLWGARIYAPFQLVLSERELTMKTQLSKLLGASALTACVFAISPNAFAQSLEDEELRTQLLNTLENLEATADGLNITAVMEEKLNYARERVLSAGPGELGEISPITYSNMSALEVSSGQMRLMYDPELRAKDSKGSKGSTLNKIGLGPTILSSGANYSSDGLTIAYPDVSWTFNFEGNEDEPDDGATGGSGSGLCKFPGTAVQTRFITMNVAITLEAIKDMAEQACGQTVLANFSLACIVTDAAYFIAKFADENQSLCNEHMGASEISATWTGLKTVHSNVQHVHDDLANVDADLASHNTAINSQISTHDTDIKSQVTTHDTDIKSQVTTHDTDIELQVATHDTDLKLQLTTHDADIKARLGEIQGTVDENQRLLVISMARQAEILRLLITPSGRREINPDVLSCTGADCPQADIVLSCENGLDWPCK